jgi:hypothetical protein
MGIYYGYVVNLEKLSDKSRGEFEDFIDDRDDIKLHTGYSVGAYDPEMAVLGKRMDGPDFLFNPVPLSEISFETQREDKKWVDNFDLSLIEKWKNCLITKEPEVILFDHTDD